MKIETLKRKGPFLRGSALWCSAAVCLGLLSLTACGGGHRSAQPSLETARLAIQEAERNEARRYAASEIIVANEKLQLAESELQIGNELSARRLGEQATVDARYAGVRAQAERAMSGPLSSIASPHRNRLSR